MKTPPIRETVLAIGLIAGMMVTGCGQNEPEPTANVQKVSSADDESSAADAAPPAATGQEQGSVQDREPAQTAGRRASSPSPTDGDDAEAESDASMKVDASATDDAASDRQLAEDAPADAEIVADARSTASDADGIAADDAEAEDAAMVSGLRPVEERIPSRTSDTKIIGTDGRQRVEERSVVSPGEEDGGPDTGTISKLGTRAQTANAQSAAATLASVTAKPEKIELGDIPTHDAKTGIVTLTNVGEEPQTLIRCQTSCGCTTTNCPTGQVLAPGESVEIDVKMTSGPRPRELNKIVTFLFSDHKPVQVPVHARAVAFVEVSPARINPEQLTDGKITLNATDGAPFTIKNMHPALITEFSTEPAASHTVEVPWDLWEELGQSRRLVFNVDHPKTGQVIANVIVRKAARKPRPPAADDRSTATDGNFATLFEAGRGQEVVRSIQAGELDVNARSSKGQTPLMVAGFKGETAAVQALLDASADIEATDNLGCTALMFAARSKSPECVRMLLDAGADLAVRDKIGNTALSWAAAFGSADTVQMLIDEGADVHVVGKITGFTPAIWAAGFGEAESLEALMAAGADIEARDLVQGNTPLMHAVQTGRADNVKLLIEQGVDLEAVNNQGRTALLVGASVTGADAETIEQLIDAGADLSATDYQGKNVLDLARARADARSPGVIELLEKHMVGGAAEADEAEAE